MSEKGRNNNSDNPLTSRRTDEGKKIEAHVYACHDENSLIPATSLVSNNNAVDFFCVRRSFVAVATSGVV